MSTKPYPLFTPPASIAAKSHRDWSKKEAQAYLEWLASSMGGRIAALLVFFDIDEDAMKNPQRLLRRLGERVAQLLEDPSYCTITEEGTHALTSMGHALAADMGLLTARLLQDTLGDSVRWHIQRKPKSDISYNLPVLIGVGPDTYDPVGVSIADAVAILAGRRGPDVWVTLFDACVADARA